MDVTAFFVKYVPARAVVLICVQVTTFLQSSVTKKKKNCKEDNNENKKKERDMSAIWEMAAESSSRVIKTFCLFFETIFSR